MTARDVVVRIDQVLRPLGFFRHKSTWNRRKTTFVDVINIQVSRWDETVTVNAGVLHSEVYKAHFGTILPPYIHELDCTVRVRIGKLIDDKDIWWRLSDPETAAAMAHSISTHVLPFLERMHAADAMERFLIDTNVTKKFYPPPMIYLAALMIHRGDRSGGCALLGAIGRGVAGPWKARVSQVAERLGCGSADLAGKMNEGMSVRLMKVRGSSGDDGAT